MTGRKGSRYSLRGLVEWLLDQVALCGAKGASPSQFVAFVHAYYEAPHIAESSQEDDGGLWAADPQNLETPNVDHAFLEYIWTCFKENPDIRIGEENQFASFTLAEAESSQHFSGTELREDIDGETTTTAPPTKNANDEGVTPPASTAAASDRGQGFTEVSDDRSQVRLFTTERRVWAVLAGHEPDKSKVKSLEFECLSTIALAGPRGILQYELVELTGQDKRSLPNRTDQLHRDGYIIKRPVAVYLPDVQRILHTSLCTFRLHPEASKARVSELTSQVKTSFASKTKIRKSTVSRLEAVEDSIHTEGDVFVDPTLEASPGTAENEFLSSDDNVPPKWALDRPIYNQLFDVIERSGTRGISIGEIANAIFGPSLRRDLEHHLNRLVDMWQLSQPLHLRHLTVIRDTMLKGKSPIYVHYTFGNYQKLVSDGVRSWDAVSVDKVGSKRDGFVIPAPDAEPELDQFGFPLLDTEKFLGESNNASLAECAAVTPLCSLDSFDVTAITTSGKPKRKKLAVTTSANETSEKAGQESPKPKPVRHRGRPRKYKVDTLPPDIKRWTAAQKHHLKTSLQAAERYQRKKIEDEIKLRIEAGQEAASAAHATLEQANEERLSSGTGSLSTVMVHQILHVYAGEPLVPDEQDESTVLTNLIDAMDSDEVPGHVYHPSVAAHSSANLHEPSLLGKTAKGRKRKRGGRRPKAKAAPYLPSIAAHGGISTALVESSTAELANLSQQSENDFNETFAGPSMELETASVPTALDTEGSRPGIYEKCAASPLAEVSKRPNKRPKVDHEDYKRAAKTQTRASTGLTLVHVNSSKTRKNHSIFRNPTHARLAIFRLPPLKELPWFMEAVSTNNHRSPSPAPQVENDSVDPALESTSIPSNRTTAPETHENEDGASLIRLGPQANDQMQTSLLESAKPNDHSTQNLLTGERELRQPEDGIPAPEDVMEVDASGDTALPSVPQTGDRTPVSKAPAFTNNTPRKLLQAPRANRKPTKPPLEPKTHRLQRTGGSMAMTRRDIIMELVKSCDGVAPGARGLRIAFGAEWKSRGLAGQPEYPTIKNAVTDLVSAGKLYNIVFSFQVKDGGSATSDIITLPEVDEKDPRVREIQKNITERHPHSYLPLVFISRLNNPESLGLPDISQLEFTSSDRMTDVSVLQQRSKDIEATEQKERASYARSMSLQNAEERDQYTARLASSGLNKSEIMKLRQLAQPRERKVQRLASIRKPTSSTNWAHSPRPLRPLSLPLRNSDANAQLPLAAKEQVRQRMHELRARAIQIDKHQKEANRNALPSNSGGAGLDTTDAGEVDPLLFLSPSDYWRAIQPDQSIPGNALPEVAGLSQTSGLPKGVLSKEFTGMRAPGPSIYQSGRTRGSAPSRPFHTFPGFMDPIHIFHRSTGTFSASFSGFRIEPVTHRSRARVPKSLSAKRHAVKLPIGWQQPFSIPKPVPTIRLPAVARDDSFPSQIDKHRHWEMFNGLPHVSEHFESSFVNYESPTPHRCEAEAEPNINDAYLVSFSGPNNKQVVTNIASIKAGPITYAGTKTPRPRQEHSDDDDGDTHLSKRRRTDSMLELSSRDTTFDPALTTLTPGAKKFRRVRAFEPGKRLEEEDALRLMYAVTVIRTLTGGTRQAIDWVLVGKVFEPKHTMEFLRSNWGVVLNRFTDSRDRMELDFQSSFLRAYEQGQLPVIDYEDLDNYDWRSLVSWAMDKGLKGRRQPYELPASRGSFDENYRLTNTHVEQDLNAFYELDGIAVFQARKKTIAKIAYVQTVLPHDLDIGNLPSDRIQADQVAAARTWIRANGATPDAIYNARVAHARLSLFPNDVVETALKALLQERVIIEEGKSRKTNRNYLLSPQVTTRLGRPISPAQLHRAIKFKEELDRSFKAEGRRRWKPNAEDGDALAVFNLVADERVSLVPLNVPLNKWGHTDGGYETRQMDKKRLNFDVDVVPVQGRYIYGNPLQDIFSGQPLSPPAPTSSLSNNNNNTNTLPTSPKAQEQAQQNENPPPPSDPDPDPNPDLTLKIPLWYSIHNTLIPPIWEACLACVTGLLALRTGAGAAEIEKSARPALERWEIVEILEWMVKTGLAVRAGKNRYRCAEWWWMALTLNS